MIRNETLSGVIRNVVTTVIIGVLSSS